MANTEVNMTLDASELKQVLDDFIQIDLPNAVREIVRDELHKRIKEAASSK